MEAFTGTILPFIADYAPDGWSICDGKLLQVNQYQALFSIIGTTYGGDGKTTFALPDLRGCAPIGMGKPQKSDTNYSLGEKKGNETVQLKVENLPPHNHPATFAGTASTTSITNGSITNGSCLVTVNIPPNAVNSASGTNVPGADKCLGVGEYLSEPVNIYSSATPNITLGAQSVTATGTVSGNVSGSVSVTSAGTVTVGSTGNGAAFSNMQPSVVINYIICLVGYYPMRP